MIMRGLWVIVRADRFGVTPTGVLGPFDTEDEAMNHWDAYYRDETDVVTFVEMTL